jgi:hypothetical protein
MTSGSNDSMPDSKTDDVHNTLDNGSKDSMPDSKTAKQGWCTGYSIPLCWL